MTEQDEQPIRGSDTPCLDQVARKGPGRATSSSSATEDIRDIDCRRFPSGEDEREAFFARSEGTERSLAPSGWNSKGYVSRRICEHPLAGEVR